MAVIPGLFIRNGFTQSRTAIKLGGKTEGKAKDEGEADKAAAARGDKVRRSRRQELSSQAGKRRPPE